MRALYVPATGEPEVLDRPSWPVAVLQEMLGGSYGLEVCPFSGPSGRALIALHTAPHPLGWLVADRRPVMFFAGAEGGTKLAPLNKRDVFYLGMIIVLEEAFALPASNKKEIESA